MPRTGLEPVIPILKRSNKIRISDRVATRTTRLWHISFLIQTILITAAVQVNERYSAAS